MWGKSRAAVAGGALVLAASALGFVAIEGGLRLAGISYPVFEAYDDARGHGLQPGAEGWYEREGRAYLEVNAQGYLDVEHPLDKPRDTFRVAVLGDSFVEARQVELLDRFWKQLEHELGSCEALEGRVVEAMGFGVGGFGTTQELITLEQDVLPYAPDAVVLSFFPNNDVVDNSKVLSERLGKDTFRPFYTLEDDQLVLDDSFRDRRLRYLKTRVMLAGLHYSRTLEVLNRARRVLAVQADRQDQAAHTEAVRRGEGTRGEALVDSVPPAPPRHPLAHAAWDLTETLLSRFHQTVQGAGVEHYTLLVLSSPMAVHPESEVREGFRIAVGAEDLGYADRRLRAAGRADGYDVLTVSGPLLEHAMRTQQPVHGFANAVPGMGHYNPAGHRLVAEQLAAHLCAQQDDPGLTPVAKR